MDPTVVEVVEHLRGPSNILRNPLFIKKKILRNPLVLSTSMVILPFYAICPPPSFHDPTAERPQWNFLLFTRHNSYIMESSFIHVNYTLLSLAINELGLY